MLVVVGLFAAAIGCVTPSLEPSILHAGQARTAELPSEFELLSWNVHKQRDRRFNAELLQFSTGVELLLLQEATEAAPVWTLQLEQRIWTLVVAFVVGREPLASGVATASTADPVRHKPLLSASREPVFCTPKSALLTWIELEGTSSSLLLVNLHGINFRPAKALAAQLRQFDAAIAAHDGPLVVAGDFNTWSRRRRAVVDAFAKRHRLVSPFREIIGRRLDNVYVRGLLIRSVEVLDSRSSDHDALRVELSLPR